MLGILFVFCRSFNIENRILKYVYPKKYNDYVEKYSKKLGIDPLLTYAIIKTESNFKENIVSKSGAVRFNAINGFNSGRTGKDIGNRIF